MQLGKDAKCRGSFSGCLTFLRREEIMTPDTDCRARLDVALQHEQKTRLGRLWQR